MIKWTGDSKTIISFGHLAMMTPVASAHFNNGHWDRVELQPPDSDIFDKNFVVKAEIGVSQVHLVFSGSSGTNHPSFYLVEFDFDPALRRYSNVTQHEITFDAYSKLDKMPLERVK